MTERYRVIMDAYEVALAGRDPSSVRIEDLLPTIFDALPGVTIPEVCAALRWSGHRDIQEADRLRRYGIAKWSASRDLLRCGNAKFGNAGKSAAPGDGTIPFPRR